MKQFEEYIEEATANKQITATLNTDKRELTFNLKGLFPPALIAVMGKSLKSNRFNIDKDEFIIYI